MVEDQAVKKKQQNFFPSHIYSHGDWDVGIRPISNIDNTSRLLAAIFAFWTTKILFFKHYHPLFDQKHTPPPTPFLLLL
jgi:hypothetical protein